MRVGLLRAQFVNIGTSKNATNCSSYCKLVLVVNGKPLYVNAFDMAFYKALTLNKGQYIEGYPDFCPYMDKQTGKLRLAFKLRDFKVIDKPIKEGLYAEDEGIVGSLDVHEAAGKGCTLISVKSSKVTTQKGQDEQPCKSYLRLLQDSYILDIINNKDKVRYSGYLDVSSNDRIIFDEILNIQKEKAYV